MSVTEELVSNIMETRFEVFPKDTIERAKDIVIDVIGCSIGGANAPGCPAMVDLIKEGGGKEESTVLAHGVRAPSHNVALANAVMARTIDYGTCEIFVDGKTSPSHISEPLVPTAIAVAEQKAIGGKELLTALILGEDLVVRMLSASNTKLDTPDSGGIVSMLGGNGVMNTLGVCAVAGRLCGVDNRQLLNAFGIVLDEIGGVRQGIYDRVHCFQPSQELVAQLGILAVSLGVAAQLGILAVGLAAKGLTGVKDPLMGERGYFTLYCRDYHPEILTKGLGQQFYTEVTFKPYPCCRGNHGGIDCALELVRKYELDARDIDEVTLIVSPEERDFITSLPFELKGAPHYTPHLNAYQSLQYNVANALLRRSVSLEHFTDEFIQDPQIAEMVKKVKITSETWPALPDETSSLATAVKVRVKDGREFFEHVNVPRGNEIYAPLTKEEKREKFRSNVSFFKKVPIENAEKALGMLEELEEIDDIAKIVKLLGA